MPFSEIAMIPSRLTLLRHKYLRYYEDGINTLDHNAHSWMIAKHAVGKLKGVVKDIIRLSGSDGKA